MDSEQQQIDTFYRLLGWAETNKSKIIGVLSLTILVGIVVAYFNYRSGARTTAANAALAALRGEPAPGGETKPIPAESYLKVVADYPRSSAAARALLLAGQAHFAAGKYGEAKALYDRFLAEFPTHPLRPEALYGTAVCLESEGKAAEALQKYKDVTDRHPTSPVVSRAKLALARLYQAQNQLEQAYRYAEELAADRFTSVGMLAGVRRDDLKRLNPALGEKPATNAPAVGPAVVAPAATTNPPAPANP